MRVPKLRKHSSGLGRVTLSGHTYYCGKYGTRECRAEYHRLVNEWLACGGTLVARDAVADLSIAEMFAGYLTWAKSHYGEQSGEFDRINRIARITRTTYGKTVANAFDFQAFESIRSRLVSDGVGRKYANESMRRLVRIFRWAAARGLVPTDVPTRLEMIEPLKRGRTSAPEAREVEPVDTAIVERTLIELPEVVADMVRVQALAGCRPAELCSLQPQMIDRSGDIWEAHLDRHKTAWRGKKRVIYIGPNAQAILGKYMLRLPAEHLFSPIESEARRLAARHEARVTPNGPGRNKPGSNRKRKPKRRPRDHYDTASYRRAIHRACDRAFPPPEPLDGEALKEWQADHRWSPNQLRHTFGTNVRRTEGLEAAALLLGHDDQATTLIYAQANRQKAIAAARKVG